MGKKKSSASLGKKAGAAAAAPAAALPAAAAPSVGDPPAEATPAEAVAVAAVASAGLPEEWWTAAQRATIDGVDALFGSPVKDDTSAQLDEGVMKEFDIEIEADDDSELTSDMVSLTPESPGASLKPEAAAPADAAAGAATDAAADQAAFDEEAWAVAASTCASQMQRRARGRAVLSFRKGISCDAFAAGLACGRFAAPASAAELHRRAAISALELDAAVHTRDFSTAAAAQLAVTALRSAAAFALAVGPLLSASLAAEAAAAHLELQFLTGTGSSGRAAKQERPQKDYIRLEILDAKLRAVEAVRRQSCPTRAELVEAVSKAEADLQLSLAKRDFVKCHALELQVGYQIALERAFEQDESLDELVAVSVLAAGMEELKGFLAEALARRDFVTCHGLEARLARKAAVLAEVSLDAEPQVVKARAARATAVAARRWRNAGAAHAQCQKWERRAAATTALKKASKRGAAVAAGGGVALHGLAPPEAAADAPPEDAPRIAKDDAPRIAKDDAPRIADASVNSSLPASDDRKKHVKTVAKLRPDAAVIVAPSDTVAKVCVAMAAKRSDCALVVLDGKLVGIVTDNDVARKALGSKLDVVKTEVREIMTANPKCVGQQDAALGALQLMVSNKFRHLPVLGVQGICGVLSIYKCIYEATAKIEALAGNNENARDLLSMATASSARTGSGGAVSLELALAPFLEALSGPSAKTLGTLLQDDPEDRKDCLVLSTDTVESAALKISKTRRAVLVVEDGGLVGILTPKDIVNRIVAKGLPVSTSVSAVMTPKPDVARSGDTALEALHKMYDCKFLHLPCLASNNVFSNNDEILGVVDVTDLIYATMGADGADGWSALLAGDDDGYSDTASDRQSDVASKLSARPSVQRSSGSLHNTARSSCSLTQRSCGSLHKEKTVTNMRPDQPLVAKSTDSIATVSMEMSAKRCDCALLVDEGVLVGILTDNDVAFRGVAKDVPVEFAVSTIMTPSPRCVQATDAALDALKLMVQNRFRHLPVLNVMGGVCGVLSIHKCLYEAISKMEKLVDQGAQASRQVLDEALKGPNQSAHAAARARLVEALRPLLEALAGPSAKTLGALLGPQGRRGIVVEEDCSVADASKIMAETKSACLVIDAGGALKGILTPKDILFRVVASGKDPSVTKVAEVCTFSPDTIEVKATLLDGLHQMHDHRYLHLPVVDASKPLEHRVRGVVDVTDLVYATMGDDASSDFKDGWSTLLAAPDEGSDGGSDGASERGSVDRGRPRLLEPRLHRDDASIASNDVRGLSTFDIPFAFKVEDASGALHRIVGPEDDFSRLQELVFRKVGCEGVSLAYKDEDGDEIVITDDDSLAAACSSARAAGLQALKVFVLQPARGRKSATPQIAAVAAAAVAVLALLALVGRRR